MSIIGIDLSMRSTGIVALNGSEVQYALLTSDAKKHQDEVMLRYNAAQILEWLEDKNPTQITIEGLSFNAKSGSKDLIAANFWYVRMELKRVYPDVPLHIIPVTMWRCPLFSKEENKALTTDRKLFKAFEKEMKAIKGRKEKSAFKKEHMDLINRVNIKWLTFQKLPTELQQEFGVYGFDDGCFDLTDAYFVGKFTQDKYSK